MKKQALRLLILSAILSFGAVAILCVVKESKKTRFYHTENINSHFTPAFVITEDLDTIPYEFKFNKRAPRVFYRDFPDFKLSHKGAYKSIIPSKLKTKPIECQHEEIQVYCR